MDNPEQEAKDNHRQIPVVFPYMEGLLSRSEQSSNIVRAESSQSSTSSTFLHNAEKTTFSRDWHAADTLSFPLSSVYETTSFADVLSGSPSPSSAAASALHGGVSQSFPNSESNISSLRSPPFQSDSSSLMELQTVTPSRIRNSPTRIINKKSQQAADRAESSNLFLQESVPTIRHDTPSSSPVFSATSNTVTLAQNDDRQFQIVISSGSDVTRSSKTSDETTGSDDEDDQRNVKAIRQELNIEQDVLGEKTKISVKGKSTKLPRELRGLMGEANLRYARGEQDDAIKMCMEVIRLAPYAAEPFDTLAMIYEERGETRKYLQYSLLAAHLTTTDADQWVHLAGLCLEQDDVGKALNCFTNALKSRPTDVKLALECAKLHKKLGNYYKAALKYKTAIAAMPSSDGEKAIKLARDFAKFLHEKVENTGAIELLQEVMKRHAPYFQDEDANMLCELLLLSRRYGDVFETLKAHSEISLKFEIKSEEEPSSPDYSKLTEIVLPSNLAIDLKCKVAISAIRLEKSSVVESLVRSICWHDPGDIGDLQLDLAEAYMETKEYPKALTILDLLVTSPQYALAAVWLRHADCCRLCGEIDKALHSYRQCINLAPAHVHTYLLYSELLRSNGRYKVAIEALDEAEGYDTDAKERMRLHMERYAVLKVWGEKKTAKVTLACDVALQMLANRLKNAFAVAKLMLVKRTKPSSNPLAGEVKLINKSCAHAFRYEHTFTEVHLDGDCSLLWRDQWMELVDETMEKLVQCKRFRDAVNLGEGAQCYGSWYDHHDSRHHLECLTFSACVLSSFYQRSYTYVRLWLLARPDCSQLWNLFNQVTARTQDQRHHRFCLRLLVKFPDNPVLGIMTAHNCLATGSYKTALHEYIRAHRKMPDDPLIMMLIGISFVHIASQKFSDHKHSLIVQGLAFMHKYAEARKVPQEFYYNIGRILHQLGLEHFAIHYYHRALECPPPVVHQPVVDGKVAEASDLDDALFDLRCEIAFNLSLIYRRSGNWRMANQLLMQHCII